MTTALLSAATVLLALAGVGGFLLAFLAVFRAVKGS